MVLDQLFSQISRAFSFLVECLKMILSEPKLLLPSLLSVIVGFVMSLVIIVPFVFMNLFGKVGYFVFGGVVLVLLFVSYSISYFFMGASAYAVYQHIRQGRSSLRDAFGKAFACLVTLLLLAATAAVIQMIVSMLKSSSRRQGLIVGLIASLAADVLREGWDIAVRLLVPVAVIAGLGYTDSFRKAFDIVKNNAVLVGVGEISIRILTGVIGFVGFLGSVLLAVGLFVGLSGLNFLLALAVAIPVAFVGLSLTSTLTLFIRTSYYTMLYAWVEESQNQGTATEGAVKAAPTPLQVAFGA